MTSRLALGLFTPTRACGRASRPRAASGRPVRPTAPRPSRSTASGGAACSACAVCCGATRFGKRGIDLVPAHPPSCVRRTPDVRIAHRGSEQPAVSRHRPDLPARAPPWSADALALIYGLIPNYAVAIAILTVIIMLLLTPLTVKSTKSMIAMQRMQPEIKKLQAKYKGPENRQKLNEELMEVYKDQGINPLGGCLPMFLQMPFLYHPLRRHQGPDFKTKSGAISPRYIPKPANLHAALHGANVPLIDKMYVNLSQRAGAARSFGMDFALEALLAPRLGRRGHPLLRARGGGRGAADTSRCAR